MITKTMNLNFIILAFVLKNCITDTESLSVPRSDQAATTVGTKAIFAGGFSTSPDCPNNFCDQVDIYDNSNNTWSNASLSMGRSWLAATTVGTKAIFAGGYYYIVIGNFNVTTQVDIYDNSNDTWSTASLSVGRGGLVATTVGTKAIFAGGYDADNGYSSQVDIYDDSNNTWSTASLSVGRSGLAATTVGTKAIFAGGYCDDTTEFYNCSAQVDIYDNSNNTWTTASLSVARYYLAATTVGTKAIFAGGYVENEYNSSAQVDIYDISNNKWSTASLSVARDGLAATTVGTKAIFAGGICYGYDNGYSDQVDIYDISNNTWSTASLSVARDGLAATTVGTKAIFAGGVYYFENIYTTQVDIYDNSSNTWSTPFPPLTYGNFFPTYDNGIIFVYIIVSVTSSMAIVPSLILVFYVLWKKYMNNVQIIIKP